MAPKQGDVDAGDASTPDARREHIGVHRVRAPDDARARINLCDGLRKRASFEVADASHLGGSASVVRVSRRLALGKSGDKCLVVQTGIYIIVKGLAT